MSTGVTQIAHDRQHFLRRFTQAQHQAGFSWGVWRSVFRRVEHVKRSFVARAQPHLAIQPRNGFGVVVQHVGTGCHDNLERFAAALEIGHQHLHAAPGMTLANCVYRKREQLGAAIRAVVAVDAGNHGVTQPHGDHGFGYAAGLVVIHGEGAPFCTAQKPQRRVQTFPRIMKVAVRRFQQSPIFGQAALSQTVCRPMSSISDFSSR